MLAYARARPAAGIRLGPTARPGAQEYRLRLKQISPIRRAGRFPLFKSSTRLAELAALALRAFLRRVNRRTAVPGLERKIAMQTNFSLQLGNRSIPGEQKESTAWPSRSGDGQLELTNN